MIGLLLGLMAYDTATTISRNIQKKEDEAERKKKLKELQWKLRRPMTRNHFIDCKCQLCVRRREDYTLEFNLLLNGSK